MDAGTHGASRNGGFQMSLTTVNTPRRDYHEQFAATYDTFYRQRDVEGEVAFASEQLGLTNGRGGDARLLDFGCGTGSHALAFGRRGIAATGFDISDAMIAQATAKADAQPNTLAPVDFAAGELRAFCRALGDERFDGAVSFFNVLNCIPTPSAMVRDLSLIRDRLAPQARFLIDVWNGAAVFADEPRPDVHHYADEHDPDVEMIRITLPQTDRVEQCCTLRYRVLTLNRRNGRFSEFESIHSLHFLTPAQYRHLFELSGLSIRDEFPKGRPGVRITAGDWYISYLVERDDS